MAAALQTPRSAVHTRRHRITPKGEPLPTLKLGKYLVRSATAQDIPRILEVDKIGFSDISIPITGEILRAWVNQYPLGFKVAEDHRGEIVGYGVAIRLRRAAIKHNWELDTEGGTCASHTPDGDILYGITLCSLAPSVGNAICLASRLIAEADPRIKEIWLYGRLSGFADWKRNNAPDLLIGDCLEQYVRLHVDRVQMFYESVGLTAIRGIENYMPEDNASLGCVVLTKWARPRG